MRVDAKSIRFESPPFWSMSKACRFVRSIWKPRDGSFPKRFQKALCKSVDKNLFRETLRRKRYKSDGVQAQGQSLDGRPQSQAQLTSMMHQSTGHMENQKAQSLRAGRQ